MPFAGITSQGAYQTKPDFKSLGGKVTEENGHYYIELDGIKIEYEEGDTIYDLQRKFRDKKYKGIIEENAEKTKEHANLFEQALAMVRELRSKFSSFLRENKVSSLYKLTGEKLKEGQEIADSRSEAISQKNYELAQTLHYSHATVGACCSYIGMG